MPIVELGPHGRPRGFGASERTTSRSASVDDTPPLVVVLGTNFRISEQFAAAAAEIHPDIRFVPAPYVETDEARTARGANNGRLDDPTSAQSIDDEQRAAWGRAHVAIVRDLPDDISSLAPHLEWVQTITAGFDTMDLDALRAAGIRLTNARGLAAKSMSEFVLARLLQIWKQLRTLDQAQDRHEWVRGHGVELSGKTVGIAGLGAIGRNVAKRLRAFDIEVLAARASAEPGDTDADVDELYPASELHDMLPRCDAVIACLPTTEQTVDLFDQRAFAGMRPGSIFCNVGRGVQVVEADLIAALESGQVGAAVLDVTRTEPLPAEDPLWSAPNLYLSPHASVSLDRYVENLEELIVENLRRFVAGEQMATEVDLSAP